MKIFKFILRFLLNSILFFILFNIQIYNETIFNHLNEISRPYKKLVIKNVVKTSQASKKIIKKLLTSNYQQDITSLKKSSIKDEYISDDKESYTDEEKEMIKNVFNNID